MKKTRFVPITIFSMMSISLLVGCSSGGESLPDSSSSNTSSIISSEQSSYSSEMFTSFSESSSSEISSSNQSISEQSSGSSSSESSSVEISSTSSSESSSEEISSSCSESSSEEISSSSSSESSSSELSSEQSSSLDFSSSSSSEEEKEIEYLPSIDYVKVFCPTTYSKIYAWVGTSTELAGSWPGTSLKTYDSHWKTYDFKSRQSVNFIFSKNGNSKTADLYAPKAGYYWYYQDEVIYQNVDPYYFGECDSAYTVTWVDYDDEVLEVDKNVLEGVIPTYDKEKPTRDTDEDGEYTFAGWSPAVTSVHKDITYKAKYDITPLLRTITFDLDGGSSPSYVGTKMLRDVTSSDLFYDVTKDNYIFRGWKNNNKTVFDEKGNKINDVDLKKDTTFTAFYSQTSRISTSLKYEAFSEYVSLSGSGEYDFGEEITLTASLSNGYEFDGWYDGDDLITKSNPYVFIAPQKDLNITASIKAKNINVNVSSANPDLGTVAIKENNDGYHNSTSREVPFAGSINLKVEATEGIFVGWYDKDDHLISSSKNYQLNIEEVNDYEIYAKFIDKGSLANLKYAKNSEGDGLVITGVKDNTVTSIIVPSIITYGGVAYPVTEIGDAAFKNCQNVTEVVLPDTITYIGKNILTGCGYLTTLSVPFIGKSEKEVMPDYPTDETLGYFFGNSEFYDNSYYREVGSTYFYFPLALKEVFVTRAKYVNKWAFAYVDSLEAVHLGNSIETIGDDAFYQCQSLKRVGINGPLKKLGERCFYSAFDLEEVNFSKDTNITAIPYRAFAGTNLKSFIMPNSVQYIGKEAFASSKFKEIALSNNLLEIGEKAFAYCYYLEEVICPSTTNKIFEQAFLGCTSLKKLEINVREVGTFGALFSTSMMDGLTKIESYSYTFSYGSSDVYSIEYFYIPSSLTDVILHVDLEKDKYGNYLDYYFYDCKTIKNITIDGIKEISNKMFYGCTKLEEVSILSDYILIEDAAFASCKSLKSFEIPESCTSLGLVFLVVVLI